MKILKALGGGLVGACALTLLHESLRRVVPNAPRMDVLGMRAISKTMRKADQEPPPQEQLHGLALVGDIVCNSMYYGLVGVGNRKSVWLRRTLLGLGAGVGAVVLPAPLGLGDRPSARTPATQAMTVGLYLAGGLAAAAVFECLAEESNTKGPRQIARRS